MRRAWIVGGSVTSSTAVASLVGKHRDELLGVERIPLRNLRHAAPELRREDAAGVERVEKLRRFAVRERLEAHVHALPLGPLLEQLGTRDAEEEDRGVAAPAAHVLDEVEQRRLGPVDVLQDDDERPFAREELEEPPHGPEELLRRSGSAAAEHAETLEHECGVGIVAHRFRHGLLAAEALDELRQRPEGDPVAVGEGSDPTATVAYAPTSATSSDTSRVLPTPAAPITVTSRHSPALRARGQPSLRTPSSRLRPTSGVSQRRANESAPAMAPSTRHASTGARLPFASTGRSGLESRGVADEPLGQPADQDVAATGCFLEPFRGVDGVARGECRDAVAGHDLPGVDADADPQLGHVSSGEGGVQPSDCALHLEGGSDRPECVVLVGLREPEDGHHGVADELLHGAAVTFDGDPHLLVPPRPSARVAARDRAVRRARSNRPGRRRGH